MEKPYYIEELIRKEILKRKKTFKGSESEFEEFVNKKLPDIFTNVSKGAMETTYQYCLSDKSDLKKQESDITKKISKNYGFGIKLFEAFIELNSKISSMTYRKYYRVFKELDDQIKLDTLIAIHVRACQVSNEVKTLVVNGYADGADARWRTIHELCITFLYLYDSDYETIRMYNDYEIIQTWKKANDYKENCERLDLEPLEAGEWEFLKEQKDNLVAKYGKEYSESYGWTMKDLPKGRRNIRELEKLVNKDYLRNIYAWASENVHAGVTGIKTKLSLRDHEQHNFLLGPNDCGFLDPVQYTSYSLSEMSIVLLDMEDSLMNKIFEELLYFFQNELVKEFDRVEKLN